MSKGEGETAGDLTHPKRVHPAIYLLITNKLATYAELKYNYSAEEFLDLYEICLVSLHNRLAALER